MTKGVPGDGETDNVPEGTFSDALIPDELKDLGMDIEAAGRIPVEMLLS